MRALSGCLVLAILMVTACGSTPADSDPLATRVSPNSTDSPPTSSPATTRDVVADYFDIGGARMLYLSCIGTGSPTILLEAGDESGVEEWQGVRPALAAKTRTCAYDRAGVGRSDEATGCRGLDDLLDDLDAPLDTVGIGGPYLLVGASGGGFLMAGFAARHPSDVAGIVLVETPKAITIMSPEVEAEISCSAPANVEHRDSYALEHAAWDPRAELGDFPMTIISNDYGVDAPPGDEQTNVADQRGWLVLSPNAKQVVVTSGHDVSFNEPDVVIREVLSVLDAARSG